ncbi:Putative pectinesterase/pectinesterase inhibitor 13 [Glycine soja]|uniref:Pectinesterase n=1 Tax=Glycine soja TaxID=3848 RepID=A0A0B2RPK4_GLYSO|nr:Putative pectinesterase/pectinesterase inhibitor 13 [Glycine soja]
MAFQDFDMITERRRNEQRLKMKKKILISVVSAVLLACVVGAAAFVVVQRTGTNAKHATPMPQNTATPHVDQNSRMVKMICGSAEYKEKCESTLEEALKKDPKLAQPKDLIMVSMILAEKEVTNAFDGTAKMMGNASEEEKGAYEDCKGLFKDAKEELELSITEVGDNDADKLSTKGAELNNWLSAVMSYQQTCIDGFPEGKIKDDFTSMFTNSRELVSNSLAVVSQFSSFFSIFQGAGGIHLPWETTRIYFLCRYVVYVKEGVYDETVTVTKKMVNLTMYGDGQQKSIVTGNKNFVDGVRTFQTASFVVLGEGFLGKDMGFRNTAGAEKHQAVAARVQADQAIFFNCAFEGYQDTLYAQTHRQFYRDCYISGTIDFIFGDASAVFQNCTMVVRKPLENQQNIVTAQGRLDKQENTGFVLQKCVIKADTDLVPLKDTIKNYLGRPWKEYSRTIIMETQIDDLIHPDGFLPWEGNFALSTLYYGEYNNNGAGSSTTARVNWPGRKVINRDEATRYTVEAFLQGTWINGTGVPAQLGLYS